MLALLTSLVFAAAATFAIGAIIVTMQGRRAQIASLLADYRSLKQDREFLVTIISNGPDMARATVAQPPRRVVRRSVKQVEAVRSARSLRVAA
ncbi:hypothetical protein [Novosphingobium sp. MMS21-SN21R]|uniref:hypothetical protein n=1 Tax=Novosphingobium sp. MMS21-SN21R TaxID=2969298 RepID=UPI00288488D4|nr:hypothetical protein [Novosphingobium sp. MMS21-SN21R]MDT0507561.1 hypothetical protein [Novosphingobium sp. MMS21-SN21R]